MATSRILLVDNGSLQPAATLALRRLSAEVAQLLGHPVHPVSVLHSHKIDPALLDGAPAIIFEQAVRQAKADGVAELIVLPLFIGPSRALTEYLPKVFSEAFPGAMKLTIRPTLFGDDGAELLAILVDHLGRSGGDVDRDLILLCDHGSPLKEVTACRDALARDLAKELSFSPDRLIACSMERREGPGYAFNEPLLASALNQAKGDVIILMLFLLPGRHAGPDGDVATIARAHAPDGTMVRLSPLLAEHPRLGELLAKRSGLPYGRKPSEGAPRWIKVGAWLVALTLAGWCLGALGWWLSHR
jgi:sirohydrochlorin ferrochelatase